MKWLKALLPSAKIWFSEKWKPVLIVVGIVLALFILWFVPKWQVRGYHGKLDASAISKLTPQELIQFQQNLITAENNARLTIAQIIGGIGLLLGLYATFKNVKIAQDNHRVALENLRVTEEGKLTERFSKAVELLGSDKIDVRLGGIYALERIARDSLKDHWTVMEILTAFVREQSVRWYKSSIVWEIDIDGNYSHPAPVQPEINISVDVQAALTVIGRRKWVEQEKSHQRIDLSKSFLKGANLRRAKLQRAILDNTNLEGVDLYSADLTNADLNKANLTNASLYDAILLEARLIEAELRNAVLGNVKLIRAKLVSANLVSARLSSTDLTDAILFGAKLSNTTFSGSTLINAKFVLSRNPLSSADLTGADLSTSIGLTWEQISGTVIDETTKLPPDLDERRKLEQAKKAAAQNQ